MKFQKQQTKGITICSVGIVKIMVILADIVLRDILAVLIGRSGAGPPITLQKETQAIRKTKTLSSC